MGLNKASSEQVRGPKPEHGASDKKGPKLRRKKEGDDSNFLLQTSRRPGLHGMLKEIAAHKTLLAGRRISVQSMLLDLIQEWAQLEWENLPDQERHHE